MSFINRLADVAHRGIVLGLLSLTAFQGYQIVKNLREPIDSPYQQSTYFKDVEQKVKEEYRKEGHVDKRDWYQAEDQSYLKDQVRPNLTKPEFKAQFDASR